MGKRAGSKASRAIRTPNETKKALDQIAFDSQFVTINGVVIYESDPEKVARNAIRLTATQLIADLAILSIVSDNNTLKDIQQSLLEHYL
jgi:hypothetical protein